MPFYYPFNAARIQRTCQRLGYQWFAGEHDLNLVAVRGRDPRSDLFECWFTATHVRAAYAVAHYAFQATTKPGLSARLDPSNVDGVAVMVPGQYRKLWRLGQHKGHEALVQSSALLVARDSDHDPLVDPDMTKLFPATGINCHRAGAERASRQVSAWSEGCQVLADPDDHAFLMTLARRQVARGASFETFTYTILTMDQMEAS